MSMSVIAGLLAASHGLVYLLGRRAYRRKLQTTEGRQRAGWGTDLHEVWDEAWESELDTDEIQQTTVFTVPQAIVIPMRKTSS